jgi:parallel beta-helix repeat protein
VSGVTAVQAASLELTDAPVRDIHPVTSACGGQRNVGVQFGTPPWIEIDGVGGSTADGRVSHVVIDNFPSEGVEVVGPPDGQPSRVKLADSTITAGSPQLPTEQFGIVILFAAVAQITGNTISGGVCNFEGCGPDPIFEFQAMGVFIEEAAVGSTVTDNHISGSDVGVYQYGSPNCCTISGNTLQDNRFFGIVIQDSDGTTSENAISGGQIGIGVVAGGADTVAVLQGDKIKQTSVASVKEIECCGFTATAIIKDH